MLRSGLRVWSEKEGNTGAASVEAEKTAAEIMWMAGKMADCGAAAEAVARWGAAARLAGLALVSEPRLQVALVRVSGDATCPLTLLSFQFELFILL